MRAKVEPSRAELLTLVLARTSNLEQLLDAPMRGTLGWSLQECDPELYDHMSRLGTLRNRIVHRGERVERARPTGSSSQRASSLSGSTDSSRPRRERNRPDAAPIAEV